MREKNIKNLQAKLTGNNMKTNYNQLMKKISDTATGEKLLLHVCCAPCTSACLERVKNFDVTLFYFNPNTYPESEYVLRRQQFDKLTNLPTVTYPYNHQEFLTAIKGNEQDKEGGIRCQKCIALRLEKTFEYAKNNGFEYVTTTLTISPHKDAEYINTKGQELEKKYGIKFLPSDFKKENGFLNSINLSKQLDLYRQDFCGCEFSYTQKTSQS